MASERYHNGKRPHCGHEERTTSHHVAPRRTLCLSARAWPLLSLGAPRAFAVLRVFALFFLLPNSSTSSSSLSQAFRSLGSCRSNSPPPLPSSAALCCFSSSIALFMSGDGCLHCMQYMAPPSFLLEHSEQVQGPMLIFSPSRQSSRGLLLPSGFRAPQDMQVCLFLKFTVLQLGLGHCQSLGSYVFGLNKHIMVT